MILEVLLARFIKSIHQTDVQGSDITGELLVVEEAVAVAVAQCNQRDSGTEAVAVAVHWAVAVAVGL